MQRREVGAILFLIVSCCRSEQGLELDLFLLQCCAALAPPDLFVNRILERFGLSNFLSLRLERPNECVLISSICIYIKICGKVSYFACCIVSCSMFLVMVSY